MRNRLHSDDPQENSEFIKVFKQGLAAGFALRYMKRA
jgi:hypothetical protein